MQNPLLKTLTVLARYKVIQEKKIGHCKTPRSSQVASGDKESILKVCSVSSLALGGVLTILFAKHGKILPVLS